MNGLKETLPKKQLIDRFGSDVIFEESGKSDLTTIAKKTPQAIHGVAASVWNRIVNRGWHPVNPRQFAPYFETKSPDLYLAISELLGVEVIRDIYYVKGWKAPKRNANLVVEMLVAWVYRSDLLYGTSRSLIRNGQSLRWRGNFHFRHTRGSGFCRSC